MTSLAEDSAFRKALQNASVPGSSARFDCGTSVDSSKRVDFLPLFSQRSDTMSRLAFNVCQDLMLNDERRKPSCYLSKTNSGNDRYAFIDALLQTRGGGVVLAILSNGFFDDPWCVACLMVARELNRVSPPGAKLKLRFVCGEGQKSVLLKSEVANAIAPDLFEEYDVKDCATSSPPENAAALAEVVTNAWDGRDGEQRTILGATSREACSELLTMLRFKEDDAELLSGTFELDVRGANDILKAFKTEMNARVVDLSDIDKLGEIALASITYSTSIRLEAIDSYRERWLESKTWDWRKATRDKFAGYVSDAGILIDQSRSSDQVRFGKRLGRSKSQLRLKNTNSTSQPARNQPALPSLIDNEIRYDLVMLYARGNTKMRTLADSVRSVFAQIGKKRRRFPSLFNQDVNLAEGHLRIFEAIMQARGGGVVLVLLSSDFFCDQWCLAVLLVVLKVQESALPAERFKLRFTCLEDDLDDIRTKFLDPFPHVFGDCDLQAIKKSTDGEMARCVAYDVWKDLDGRGNDKRETALGGSVHQAVFVISQIFTMSEISKLMGTSQTGHPELFSDPALIAVAVLKGFIDLKCIENLQEIVRKNESVPPQWRLDVLDAYRQRWKESWNWSFEKVDSLVADALSVTEELQNYFEQQAMWAPLRDFSRKGANFSDLMSSGALASHTGKIDIESCIRQGSSPLPKPSVTYVHGMDDPKSPERRIKAELMSIDEVDVGARVVVTGLSGIGKSEACMGVLADEEVRDRFSDGVFWLQLNRAEKKDTVVSAIVTLVATLYGRSKTNLEYAIETLLFAKGDGIKCARRLISPESRAVGRRFLLVIDDVWRSDIVDAVLDVLPAEASVVVTTCLPKIVATFTSVRINVGRMSDDAAEKLLEKLMDRTKPFSDSERRDFVSPILTKTGGLPLGIVIAGSMLAEANGEWEPIVKLLRRDGPVSDQFAMPNGPRYACDKVHKTVRAALESCVKYIDDSASLLAFHKLGILPVNTFIDEKILAKLWGYNNVTEMARVLGDLGLVLVTEVAGNVLGIELHGVVGAYALAELQMRKQEKAVHQELIEAYQRENGFTGQDEESGLDSFPLWKVPTDGYFYENIGRHAVGAQNVIVASYIVDARWRKARDRVTPGAWLDTDLECAIQTLQPACNVSRSENSEGYGWLCVFTGVAYYKRDKGQAKKNIETCISFLAQGLRMCRQNQFPNLFAAASYALGDAYRKRIEGAMVHNAEEAIAHYKNALQMYTRDAFPKRWGETMYKMMIVQYDAGLADAALETAMKLEASYADAQDSTQDENCQDLIQVEYGQEVRCHTSLVIASDGGRRGASLGALRVGGLAGSCTIS